jgi:cytochrome c556
MPSPSVKPDLVVYLQAEESGPASALHAIDRSIDPARWSELVRAHQRHFFAYSETPLLVVRTGSQSALSSAEAKEALWRRIDDFRGGKTYLGGEVDAWLGGSPTAP